jgi:SPP1 gp7 family putative phage head morphogenesis protein
VLKRLSEYLRKIDQTNRLGVPVPVTWLYEGERMSHILRAIREEEARIAKGLVKEISNAAIQAITSGTVDAASMLTLYNSLGLVSISASFTAQLRRQNIEAMVGAFDSQRQRIFQALAANQAQALEEALITGLATGRNPLEVVAMLKKQIADLPMMKASMIARTEMLRAYREGSRQMYQRSGVVRGWIWHCAPNACAVCQALYGMKFPLDEPMNDHPNGRCAMIPETETWEDILGPQGKGIEDTRVKLESNEDHFKALGEKKQQAILGKSRYEMWKKGELSLDDMITSKHDPVWGRQWGLKTLKELQP